MNCNIVKDLIPLCIDNCCSEESTAEVKKHIECCEECKKNFDSMTSDFTEEKRFDIRKYTKINDWKASVLQSVLFLFSFLLITFGVYIEAGTDFIDYGNGLAAFNAVVPATAFMLSLVNWYFVKFYKSKKLFSWCSCALTIIITVFAFAWCAFHYKINIIDIFSGVSFIDFIEGISFLFGIGIILTAVFTVLSKTLSSLYAKMLGKE